MGSLAPVSIKSAVTKRVWGTLWHVLSPWHDFVTDEMVTNCAISIPF